MKYCFFNLRMNIKISRRHHTNVQLAREYRQDKMKNKIFKIFKNFFKDVMNSRKKQLE